MAGVAHAVHAALDVALGVHLVVAPQRRRAQLDLDRVVADEVVHDPRGDLLVDLGRRVLDVVAPDDQPLVPRADHPDEAHADPAHVGAGLHDPVEDARAVRDVLRQVRVEDDVHRPRPVHLALHRQADVLRDLRAAAVGADQVLGADRVALAADAVLDLHGDAVSVLRVRQVLGVEAHAAAAPRGLAEDDRLEDVLRQVVVGAGAGERVVGQALRVRAPRVQAGELVAGQAGAEHRVAHQVVRDALGLDLVLEAHVAHDLDGALVGDVGARRVRRPAVLRDDEVVDAVGAQEQRARASGRAGADDQDVGLDHCGARTRS